jgi:hypothetical protein
MSLAAFPVAVPEEDNGTMNRTLKKRNTDKQEEIDHGEWYVER